MSMHDAISPPKTVPRKTWCPSLSLQKSSVNFIIHSPSYLYSRICRENLHWCQASQCLYIHKDSFRLKTSKQHIRISPYHLTYVARYVGTTFKRWRGSNIRSSSVFRKSITPPPFSSVGVSLTLPHYILLIICIPVRHTLVDFFIINDAYNSKAEM